MAEVISGVASHDAWRIWHEVEPILRRATDRTNGRVSTQAVFDQIRDRKMQLWIAGSPIESAAVTEILTYPHAKACRVVLAAGRLESVLRGMAMVEEWAAAEGCQSIEIEGRRGWERLIRDYTPESVILRKALT